ncbi:Os08g0289133 [Oryza sativa Japonica Group]|uniref:Os08g0289133 protein n=1 Tax=Oryza sativa subsp. japonica TaxID=39947 RepID=A0A0N7KPL4_ORYSJ|nr:Os08g0289133 [Oryza sativa Japonica Group]
MDSGERAVAGGEKGKRTAGRRERSYEEKGTIPAATGPPRPWPWTTSTSTSASRRWDECVSPTHARILGGGQPCRREREETVDLAGGRGERGRRLAGERGGEIATRRLDGGRVVS